MRTPATVIFDMMTVFQEFCEELLVRIGAGLLLDCSLNREIETDSSLMSRTDVARLRQRAVKKGSIDVREILAMLDRALLCS